MDILADLAGMQKQRGNPCVRVRIQHEHPDLLESFDKGVANRQFSCQSVSDWFTLRDVDVSEEMVRKHRAGTCMTCRRTS